LIIRKKKNAKQENRSLELAQRNDKLNANVESLTEKNKDLQKKKNTKQNIAHESSKQIESLNATVADLKEKLSSEQRAKEAAQAERNKTRTELTQSKQQSNFDRKKHEKDHKAQLDQLAEENKGLSSQVNSLSDTIESNKKAASNEKEKLHFQNVALESQLNDQKSTLLQKDALLATANEKNQKSGNQINDLNTQLEEQKSANTSQKTEFDKKLSTQKEEHNKTLEEKQQKLSAGTKKIQELQQTIDQKNKEINDAGKKNIESHVRELDALRELLNDHKKELESEKSNHEQYKKSVASQGKGFKEQLNQKDQEIQKLKDPLKGHKDRDVDAEKKLNDQQNSYNEKIRQLEGQLKSQKNEYGEKMKSLEGANNQFQENLGKQRSLIEHLAKEKEQNMQEQELLKFSLSETKKSNQLLKEDLAAQKKKPATVEQGTNTEQVKSNSAGTQANIEQPKPQMHDQNIGTDAEPNSSAIGTQSDSISQSTVSSNVSEENVTPERPKANEENISNQSRYQNDLPESQFDGSGYEADQGEYEELSEKSNETLAKDKIAFDDSEGSLARDQIAFDDVVDNVLDPITKAIREQIIKKQQSLLQKSIADNDNDEEIRNKSLEDFRRYLETNEGKIKASEIMQDPSVVREMRNIESEGYAAVHNQFSDRFQDVPWEQDRSSTIRNASGEEVCKLTETTVSAGVTLARNDGSRVHVKSYRQIDFPKELESKNGPMHVSMVLKDENGKNMPEKWALYFSGHYDDNGKLTEVSSPAPVKFMGEGKDAIGYIEKEGKIYTLPVTQEKYHEMMQEVAKNKGINVDLSQSAPELSSLAKKKESSLSESDFKGSVNNSKEEYQGQDNISEPDKALDPLEMTEQKRFSKSDMDEPNYSSELESDLPFNQEISDDENMSKSGNSNQGLIDGSKQKSYSEGKQKSSEVKSQKPANYKYESLNQLSEYSENDQESLKSNANKKQSKSGYQPLDTSSSSSSGYGKPTHHSKPPKKISPSLISKMKEKLTSGKSGKSYKEDAKYQLLPSNAKNVGKNNSKDKNVR